MGDAGRPEGTGLGRGPARTVCCGVLPALRLRQQVDWAAGSSRDRGSHRALPGGCRTALSPAGLAAVRADAFCLRDRRTLSVDLQRLRFLSSVAARRGRGISVCGRGVIHVGGRPVQLSGHRAGGIAGRLSVTGTAGERRRLLSCFVRVSGGIECRDRPGHDLSRLAGFGQPGTGADAGSLLELVRRQLPSGETQLGHRLSGRRLCAVCRAGSGHPVPAGAGSGAGRVRGG